MNFWGHAGDWMLVLHFGSCLGCVEPVLLEWSVPCPGGSGEAQWERYFFGFRGLFRELWACYRADASDMGAFRRAVCIWGEGYLVFYPG